MAASLGHVQCFWGPDGCHELGGGLHELVAWP